MAILSKNDLFNLPDVHHEDVELPHPYSGTIRIRKLSGYHRDLYDNVLSQHQKGNTLDRTDLRASMIALCLVDEKGNLLLDNEADVARFNKKPNDLIDFIYGECLRVNWIDTKSTEAAIKNSKTPPPDASG